SKEAGLGLGGGDGDDAHGGSLADLGAALRRETVEAKTDTPGENVFTGVKRRTEHGDASVAYTHVQPGAAERGRSTAPPAVPDSRKAAVRGYFTRKQCPLPPSASPSTSSATASSASPAKSAGASSATKRS